jgi:hypothetical protein
LVLNNAAFTPTPQVAAVLTPSETLISTLTAPATTGSYNVRVFATTAGSLFETTYQTIPVKVAAAIPTPTPTQVPDKHINVAFTVTDSITGKKVSNAKVTIDGLKNGSGEHGMVVIHNVTAGSHVYIAAAKKHLPASATFSVTGSTTINVQLSPIPKVVENHGKDD